MELADPEPLVPKYNLDDADIPVFLLLQELRKRGWHPTASKVDRTLDAPKRFWQKNIPSKRCYIQCLLQLDRVLAFCSDRRMHSGQVQDYYMCLLKGLSASPNKRSEVYKAMLRGDAPDELHGRERARCGTKLVIVDADCDGEVFDEPAAETGGGEREEPSAALSEPPKVHIVADDDDEPFPFDIGLLERVEGAHVSTSTHHGAVQNYRRLVLICRYHKGCRKHRNCGRPQQALLGASEPLAFLGAWHRAGAPGGAAHGSRKAHVDFSPDLASQRAWLAEAVGDAA